MQAQTHTTANTNTEIHTTTDENTEIYTNANYANTQAKSTKLVNKMLLQNILPQHVADVYLAK